MFPLHPNEAERLKALRDLDVLHSPPEPQFDTVCRTAQALFGVPIALVSLVGETEQWFKAKCGLQAERTPRAISFCTYTILSDEVMVVEDATRDHRFSANPLVTGEPRIRFYAGAPLVLSPGIHIGTLCIIDVAPRTFSPEHRRQLADLAQVVVTQLRLHRAEHEARAREADYRLLADNTTDMIVRADLDGTRRYVSPACERLLGYAPEELIGTKPLDLVHPEDVNGYARLLGDLRQGLLSEALTQQRYRRRDGTWVWVEISFSLTRDEDTGRPDGYVAVLRDISERKEAEQKAALLARHDPLTGLPNRLHFRERLEQEIARAERSGGGFALLCLDLDRFKLVNDTLGHQAGDALLRVVAERLKAVVRTEDMIARLGGDEFVIIQTGKVRGADAQRLAERLIAAMAPPVDLRGYPAGVGASIGIALAPRDGLDPDHLFARADQALYRAKAAGRNTFHLYSPDHVDFALNNNEQASPGAVQQMGLLEPETLFVSELLRDILESSTDCVKLLDDHGRLLFLSAGGLKVMEIEDVGPFLGRSWAELWQGEHYTAAKEAVVQARAGQAARFRGFCPTAKGQPRWWDVALSPVRGLNGTRGLILAISRDVTAQVELERNLQATASRYMALTEASATMIWRAEPDGSLIESSGWEAYTGQPESAYQGFGWLSTVHPDDRQRVTSTWREIFASQAAGSLEFRALCRDGAYRWTLTRAVPLRDASGQVQEWVGTDSDVHESKQATEAIWLQEERLRLALQAGRMVAWEHNLQTGYSTRSQNAIDLLGIQSGPSSQFLDRVHPDDREWIERVVQRDNPSREQREFRYIHPDGRLIWLSTAVQRVGEDRIVGITFDISGRKRAEEQAWRAANHDPLTELPNRTVFHQRLEQALETAEQRGTSASLLLIDLDLLRDVNDALGHDIGDAVLREAASRLGAGLRSSDLVARLAGDEFAVLLTEPLGLEHAAKHAQTLTERLARPFEYRGRTLRCRASIGLAAYPDHHRDPRELLKDADIALHQAKVAGRGRVAVFSPQMRVTTEKRIAIADEVRLALAEHEIVPFYQPKVCFTTGRVVGFEALARWQHPSRGLLTPSYFGVVFDDPEIATAISDSLLQQIMADMRSWRQQGLDFGRVAVNFSSAEFRKPDLAGSVLDVLGAFGVLPSQFEVEVTETVFLGHGSESVPGTLQRLHDTGVMVTLDDFGTGFASLTHLKQFPVDHIKVDQSFVRDLEQDEDDAAIVAAVIGLGRSLGMQVTAEGVETEAQAQRLREMGCDYAQGYLYAKPMAGSRVPWLLTAWMQDAHAKGSTDEQTMRKRAQQ